MRQLNALASMLVLGYGLILTGCVSAPKTETVARHHAAPVESPLVENKPKSSVSKGQKSTPYTSRAEEKHSSKRPQRPQGLPSGWTILDPKSIIIRIEQEIQTGGVVLFTQSNSGLEVVGARDAQKQERYKGKLDGGHLIALMPNTDKVLVLFSNRQNAKFSILLSYQP